MTSTLKIQCEIQPGQDELSQLLGERPARILCDALLDAVETFSKESDDNGKWLVTIRLAIDAAEVSQRTDSVSKFRRRILDRLQRVLDEGRLAKDSLRKQLGIAGSILLTTTRGINPEASNETQSGADSGVETSHGKPLTIHPESGTISSFPPTTVVRSPEAAAYINAVHDRELQVQKELLSARRAVGRRLRKVLEGPRPSFKADETGYRESFDFVDAIHRDAALCRCSLTMNETQVYLRRLLPPHCSRNNQIQFAIHDFQTTEVVQEASTRIPMLSIGTRELSDQEGDFEIVRQQRIETFRRHLQLIAGKRSETKQKARELRTTVNSYRRKLGLGFGIMVDEALTRVILSVASSSFLLRESVQGGRHLSTGTDFPALLLIEEDFRSFYM